MDGVFVQHDPDIPIPRRRSRGPFTRPRSHSLGDPGCKSIALFTSVADHSISTRYGIVGTAPWADDPPQAQANGGRILSQRSNGICKRS